MGRMRSLGRALRRNFRGGPGLIVWRGPDWDPVRRRLLHRPLGHRLVRPRLSPPEGGRAAAGSGRDPREGVGRARALPRRSYTMEHSTDEKRPSQVAKVTPLA